MEIAVSARKHRVSDEDILAALRVPFAIVSQGTDRVLVIGITPSAQLLELIDHDHDHDTDDAVVIHAMPLRPKFYRFLKR